MFQFQDKVRKILRNQTNVQQKRWKLCYTVSKDTLQCLFIWKIFLINPADAVKASDIFTLH